MMPKAYRGKTSLLAFSLLVSVVACGGGGAQEGPKDPYTAAYEDCMRYGGANPMICETVARQKAGPQTKTNTDTQWAELEATASEKAKSAGATDVSPAVRISNVGFNVEHEFAVEPNRCYDVGIAWSSGFKAAGAVMFMSGEGNPPVNENVGGKNLQIDAPAGTVTVCADNAGKAKLSLGGVGNNGAMLNNERLEFAIAIGTRAESAAQTTERRAREAREAEEGRAQIETNLQMAESRQYGEAFATSCSRCRARYRPCLAKSKADRREAQKDCMLDFETCAQALGTNSSGRVLCGSPP